ncbi:MAG: mechanosensitive ion channel family protein [Acidimicrobiia bacterium]
MENLEQLFNPESNSFWNLLLGLAVLAASLLVARILRRRLRDVLAHNNIEESASALIARVAGWAIVLVGVLIFLAIMGVDMTATVIVLVISLVFVALSAKSLIENWVAGLLLQARGPYKIGDRVETNGYSGFVDETNLRSVVLRTPDGKIVHVPNTDVLTNPLVNETGEDGVRRSSQVFGVAYGSDFDAIEKRLVEVTSSIDGVILDPKPPTAWISELGDTTVNIEVRFWHQYGPRHVVRSDVADACLAALEEAGVSMPFPTSEVVVHRDFGDNGAD